jgi:hypothetical protein
VRVGAIVERLSGAPTEVRVRGSFALLLAFVAVAGEFGLEVILGAFVAGAIVSSLAVGHEHPLYHVKVDAIRLWLLHTGLLHPDRGPARRAGPARVR